MAIPQHQIVSDWVRAHIESGQYSVDDKLPSENELGTRFEVSRLTVRRALFTLESEGLIYRKQGLGSFVRPKAASGSLIALSSFEEDMRRAGLEPSTQVISQGIVPSTEYIAKRLGLDVSLSVYELRRLRLADGNPIAVDITWLPPVYGQLLEGQDLEHKSLFEIIEKMYQIPILKGCYGIEAKAATVDCASMLGFNEGDPVLLLQRLTYTERNRAVFYQHRFYRPERIRFDLLLERGKSESEVLGERMPLKEISSILV